MKQGSFMLGDLKIPTQVVYLILLFSNSISKVSNLGGLLLFLDTMLSMELLLKITHGINFAKKDVLKC